MPVRAVTGTPPIARVVRGDGDRARIILPHLPAPLLGREGDVAAVLGHFHRAPQPGFARRLVTLTGPGGVGKTSLALAVGWAGAAAGAFPDGITFVELGALRDPALVVPAIARALGLADHGDREPLDALCAHLERRRHLLVLDNCEQIVGAAADLAALLSRCPDVAILATSRESLRVRWEYQFAVPPLALPDPAGPLTPEAALASPAVALFADRLRAARPEFVLTPANVRAVAAICVRLDGLPLAIELAAACGTLLPPEALLARLGRPLDLLIDGPRDLPPRHRTLRGTIAWSYDLLTPAERAIFRHFAVFAGGATLAQVEAVCRPGDPAALLPALGALIAKGLLRVVSDEPRYRMLETIRDYALEQLAASDEEMGVRERHRRAMLDLLDAAEPGLLGEEYPAWLDRLEREHENLRAALRWAIDRGDAATALRFGGVLWRFWPGRGHLREGRAWLDAALALPGAAVPELRARALHGAGRLATEARDTGAARRALTECLEFWRERGDHRQVADLQNDLGLVEFDLGDDDAAGLHYHAALDAHRAAGAGPMAEGTVLNNLGLLAQRAGQLDVAQDHFVAALRLVRAAAAPWAVATVLRNLGRVRREERDYLGARDLCIESLALARGMDDRGRIALCLYEFAALAAIWGQDARAWRLAGAAAGLLSGDGIALAGSEEGWIEVALAPVRQRVPARQRDALWAEGQALTLDAAIAEAQAVDPVAPRAGARSSRVAEPAALSRRERQVAEQVALGLTNRQIAEALSISDRTIDTHVANCLYKLGLANRAQLAAWYVERGEERPADSARR